MSDKKINPWIRPRVEHAEKHSSPARYIIEVKPERLENVKTVLSEISDVEILSTSADRYIIVIFDSELIDAIQSINGVVKISADTVAYIKRFSFLTADIFDPWVGQVGLSSVEIECNPMEIPFILPKKASEQFDQVVYTTAYTREYLGVPENTLIDTKVAVLDTGLFIPHALMRKMAHLKSFTDEIPTDGQGHGTWCSTAAFGDDANHPIFGRCEGIAHPTEQMHGKVLSNAGFGMTSWILDGMYYAVKEYGAKVVSMSLGGPLQGSAIEDDPMCRLISDLSSDAIFVVAAGNEGPNEWTIGSPGACPDAITVASWGITRNETAGFSSRGPSGEFYKENREIWEHDLAKVGDSLIKPDIACPGGDDLAAEKILSGCAGWYDPIADLLPQFGLMMGTSMATPHAAGLIALGYNKGYVTRANDIRRKFDNEIKSIDYGYGLLTWDILTR